jgi:hypothetical protein
MVRCAMSRTENPRVGGSIRPWPPVPTNTPPAFSSERVSALSQIRSSLVDDLTNRGNHYFRLKVPTILLMPSVDSAAIASWARSHSAAKAVNAQPHEKMYRLFGGSGFRLAVAPIT